MQILSSQVINGDAVMGTGTYLTKLGPSYPRHVVAKNNYDGFTMQWQSKIQAGKTDACFEMKLPKDKVQDHSSELTRDVYLYPGNINLSEFKDLKVHIKTGDTIYITIGQKFLWPEQFDGRKYIHQNSSSPFLHSFNNIVSFVPN